MHPFNDALPAPYLLVQVTHGALVAHRYTYAFLFLSQCVSLWNDLADPMFDGVGLAGFKSNANAFLLG